MTTKSKTQKIHWTPDTPATTELIIHYANNFMAHETDSGAIAGREAASAYCRAKLNEFLKCCRPTKTPITSVKGYTMNDVMKEVSYFYSGFCAGGVHSLEIVRNTLDAMGWKLPKEVPPKET